MSTLRSRLAKLETHSAAGGDCRCPRDDDDGREEAGAVEVSRETLLVARCDRCGGFYQLRIIEVVVNTPGEAAAVLAGEIDNRTGLARRPDRRLEFGPEDRR